MGSGSDGVKISEDELYSTLATLAQTLSLFSDVQTTFTNLSTDVPYWSNLGTIDDTSGDLQYVLEDLSDSVTNASTELALDLAAFFNEVENVRDSWSELDAALAKLKGED